MYRLGGAAVIVLGVLLVGTATAAFVPEAAALTREELEARRAERAAEREARRAQREADRAAREAEREAEEEGESGSDTCSCSAALGFAKPDLQWRGTGLVFIPRVDVTIRTNGEATDPNWSAQIAYEGSAAFDSEDVTVPSPASFSGSRMLGEGPCGDNRYTFRGLALEPVGLAGLTRALVGPGEEVSGKLQMSAHIQGCGFDIDAKEFSFRVQDFGNLSVRGWRTVR
jgi:hypothetical protein